jgi:hypothetical protein
MEMEMRDFHARMYVMKTTQRRAPNTGDISDAENEEREIEEFVVDVAIEDHLLKEVMKLGAREKIDIPMYEGNLDVEELLHWI